LHRCADLVVPVSLRWFVKPMDVRVIECLRHLLTLLPINLGSKRNFMEDYAILTVSLITTYRHLKKETDAIHS
jgi:hypothetical protein